MQLTGSQRCAVFLLAVDEEVAADMLGSMRREEVARIAGAMAHLPPVPEEMVRTILQEARAFLTTRVEGLAADRELAGRLLRRCLGERDARETMRTWGPAEQPRPFAALERMRPGQLCQLLRQEHPQTQALILGHLSASQAVGVLMRLPMKMRSLLLEQIGGLMPVDEDILQEMDSVLSRQAADTAHEDQNPGLHLVAEIVAAAGGKTGEGWLAALERDGSRLPALLGRLVRCPEDCLHLDGGLLAEALEESSAAELAAVLAGCREDVRTAFLMRLPEAQRTAVVRLLRAGQGTGGGDRSLCEDFLRRVRRLQAECLQADLDAARDTDGTARP